MLNKTLLCCVYIYHMSRRYIKEMKQKKGELMVELPNERKRKERKKMKKTGKRLGNSI